MPSTQTRAAIYGPISPAGAELLRELKTSFHEPKKQELLSTIGASVGPYAVALVVLPAEGKGEYVPSHFVSLDADDMGADLLPNGTLFEALQLPTPAEADDMLRRHAADNFDQELLALPH